MSASACWTIASRVDSAMARILTASGPARPARSLGSPFRFELSREGVGSVTVPERAMHERTSRMPRFLAVALFAASAPFASDGAAAPPASPPQLTLAVEKSRLENGLELILHEDHRTPIVTVNLWYHVGSKDEPKGKNGFAHLFEHVMFQGSKHVPEDTYF